ncbi:hypothetical protein D3C71_2025000 [compost metagenome]
MRRNISMSWLMPCFATDSPRTVIREWEKNISRVLVRLVRSIASIIVLPLTVKVMNGGEVVLPPPLPPMPLAPEEGLMT